ncbi:MAG: Minf_1886 family protein, partial [Planctomycetaceae bacterium]
MSTSSKLLPPKLRFHPDAYRFVFEGLKQAQQQFHKAPTPIDEEAGLHITGQELLAGIRDLAIELYGPMALTVFRHWGVRSTEDFGRIVFELI